jgi:NAD(P)-dependent dehydrogenase (short-subunit alcohol dehydrogenase family)
MSDSMHGKVVIVTGANTGIGKATALGLARRGATTVLACRDLEKGQTAMAEIRAQADASELHLLRLDLASLESVRAFAGDFAARFSRLDVLIENAGVSTGQRQVSADGYELDFAVNHLGHFLLTRLLLPQLQAAAPSRIVVVSSSVHKGAALDFDDLQGERRWSMMGSYSRSKLANMLFTRTLAKRLEGSGVTVNALHPGVVASELARDFPAPFRWLARLLFKSTEAGARTSLFVATAPELASVSGGYFANARAAKPGKAALDDVAAERLWEVSEKLVALESGPTA